MKPTIENIELALSILRSWDPDVREGKPWEAACEITANAIKELAAARKTIELQAWQLQEQEDQRQLELTALNALEKENSILRYQLDEAYLELDEANGPVRACTECGNSGKEFTTITHREGDYDVECSVCGSWETCEYHEAVSELVDKYDRLLEKAADVEDKWNRAQGAIDICKRDCYNTISNNRTDDDCC